jgi:hypothetical protein
MHTSQGCKQMRRLCCMGSMTISSTDQRYPEDLPGGQLNPRIPWSAGSRWPSRSTSKSSASAGFSTTCPFLVSCTSARDEPDFSPDLSRLRSVVKESQGSIWMDNTVQFGVLIDSALSPCHVCKPLTCRYPHSCFQRATNQVSQWCRTDLATTSAYNLRPTCSLAVCPRTWQHLEVAFERGSFSRP